MNSKGHPLPGSDEARHNEIPEHLERDKGRGDDPHAVVQPAAEPVTPEGEPYRYDDLGRGPSAAGEETHMADERRDDATDERPRGQQQAGLSGGGRQVGGGPEPSDMRAPGGSSGAGGYGNAIEQQQQEQQDDTRTRAADARERGASFDEQQGGGRGEESVSELKRDAQVSRAPHGSVLSGGQDDLGMAAHQDRGQSIAEVEERER